jgi:XTP/dITP diphosphohydrolase
LTVRVVLASNNRGKLREFAELLAPLGFELVPQDALRVTPVEETAITFVENALLKARHAAAASGHGAIADDSGLVVPALGGRPGVRSARYAGEGATDADNNALLIQELDGIDDRRAWYYCAVVHLEQADDPVPSIATATWHGHLLTAPCGTGGFGYDPLFLVPELGCTAAQLDSETKNRLSHRGHAVRALVELLRVKT